jgi:hypothetical protein
LLYPNFWHCKRKLAPQFGNPLQTNKGDATMNWLLAWLALNALVLVWRLEVADREGRMQ